MKKTAWSPPIESLSHWTNGESNDKINSKINLPFFKKMSLHSLVFNSLLFSSLLNQGQTESSRTELPLNWIPNGESKISKNDLFSTLAPFKISEQGVLDKEEEVVKKKFEALIQEGELIKKKQNLLSQEREVIKKELEVLNGKDEKQEIFEKEREALNGRMEAYRKAVVAFDEEEKSFKEKRRDLIEEVEALNKKQRDVLNIE